MPTCSCVGKTAMEYYAALKKEDLLPFETAWRDVESVTLSRISRSEKDTYPMVSLTRGIE